MKIKHLVLPIFLCLGVLTTSCEEDDTIVNEEKKEAKIVRIEDLNAGFSDELDSGGRPVVATDFTKFSFSQGKVVEGDDWDIAFLGTSIIVNNSESVKVTQYDPEKTGSVTAYSVIEDFSDVEIDDNLLDKDSKLGNALSKWYTYNGETHIVSPIAGMTHVVKTSDGHYAKFVIHSYYRGAPENPTDYSKVDARFYTFSYSYE